MVAVLIFDISTLSIDYIGLTAYFVAVLAYYFPSDIASFFFQMWFESYVEFSYFSQLNDFL